MIEIDYLIVADAATAVEGKHYIQGAGWDRVYVAHFPVVHPAVGIAVRLRVPWTDTNQSHQLTIALIDADGQSVLPDPPGTPGALINLGRPPHLEPGTDQTLCLAFNLYGLRFERPGAYAFVARIDGRDLARAPFLVTTPPGQPPPQS